MEMIAITLSVASPLVTVMIARLWQRRAMIKFGLDLLHRNDQGWVEINRRALRTWITVYVLVLAIGWIAGAVWLTWVS